MARAWASHAPAYHLSTSVLQGGKLRACQRTATETQRGRVRTRPLRGHPIYIETIQQRCIPNIQCGSATGLLDRWRGGSSLAVAASPDQGLLVPHGAVLARWGVVADEEVVGPLLDDAAAFHDHDVV